MDSSAPATSEVTSEDSVMQAAISEGAAEPTASTSSSAEANAEVSTNVMTQPASEQQYAADALKASVLPSDTSVNLQDSDMVANDESDPFTSTSPIGEKANATVTAVPSSNNPMHQLPADIEHILSLGVADKDPNESRASSNLTELEQVVKQLKQNAGMGQPRQTVVGSTELDTVEKEMQQQGVTRPSYGDEEKVANEDATVPQDEHDGEADTSDDDESTDSSDTNGDSDDASSSSDEEVIAQPKKQAANASDKNRGRQRQTQDDDDEDDDGGGIDGSCAPKTEHEVEQPEIAMPTIDKVPQEHALAPLGKVQSIIENVVVIKANAEGSYRVLDEGTVCCWDDRTVIGSIFETFGSVHQPFYSLRFPASFIPDTNVYQVGRAVFYAPTLATFVFTRELRNVKGTDASNVWDEEAGAAEIEFSDDEAEQEYKRAMKADRKAATAVASKGKGKQQSQQRVLAPPNGMATLPQRPATSYADIESSVDDIHRPQSMRSGIDVGTKPPSGREGRRMFERDTGTSAVGGLGAEFEFSENEDDDGGDSNSGEDRPSQGAGPSRGFERERGAQRGRDRGRGRGIGRGRGRGSSSSTRPVGRAFGDVAGAGGGPSRQIAGLPPRPMGLPQKPIYAQQPSMDMVTGMLGAPGSFVNGSMPHPPPFSTQPSDEYDPTQPAAQTQSGSAHIMQQPQNSSFPTYAQPMYGAPQSFQQHPSAAQYPTFNFGPPGQQPFAAYPMHMPSPFAFDGISHRNGAPHQNAPLSQGGPAGAGHFNPRFFGAPGQQPPQQPAGWPPNEGQQNMG
ncbi:hypothetical protein OIO90_000630 [Microbotryomycetes sp. JL221]|nr:hypothetical protein OIO90_000630 [Microbotryomycetes sp. JL221]